MALALVFVLSSCQKESIAPETSSNGTEIQNRIADDPFLLAHPEILTQALEAMENGEEYSSEIFSYTPTAEELASIMKDENRTAFAGLAGTQLIFGPFGGLKLVRSGYTLYGYNVVDDFVSTSAIKDRFKFELPSSTSWRLTKHYTYDSNLNLVTSVYRNVPPGCTRFSFLTSAQNLGIGSIKDCSW